MKLQTKLLPALALLLALFYNTQESLALGNGVGTAAGADFMLTDNIFAGGDAFYNYYGDKIINSNYGAKGRLGLKAYNISFYGIGGIQRSQLAGAESNNFKSDTSPIYGFGLGYDFPMTGFGIRLNRTFFELERKTGVSNRFQNLDMALVLAF
ncbi:MAG: hypothetical protein K0R25_442 [Rickettsiaceae bacterium]|jgi:hypothetical protein|nr:hypothetical protein [Rickettsiaceae bacterium]